MAAVARPAIARLLVQLTIRLAACLAALTACGGERRPAASRADTSRQSPAPAVVYRAGIRFEPASLRPGTRVGSLVADSVEVRRAFDSSYVGVARFDGEIEVSGSTLLTPDPDYRDLAMCFEADSASAARLPRWQGDERRAWFCLEDPVGAARVLGPPSEGVRATIAIDRFTINRGLSDEVNTARLVRLVRGGPAGR